MDKELTYILGAGASFQSIPVVKTFPRRFNKFLNFVNSVYNGYDADYQKEGVFKKIYSIGNALQQSFSSHQSFDTYFKKLFHTGEFEKINEAKKALNLYFIWEHVTIKEPIPDNYNELSFWKQSHIDKRYDALIAGLLQPVSGQLKAYCKVNFITWNYDMNLISSLKNYFYPSLSYKDYFKMIKKEGDVWIINDEFFIYNMNGFFYSSLFDDEKGLINIPAKEIVYQKANSENYFLSENQDSDANYIKFAWEGGNEENKILAKVKEKIKDSESIVIIGYTFPLYNRLIDLSYLNEKLLRMSVKNIYIQDPNAAEIKEGFIDDFGVNEYNLPFTQIHAVEKCDNFIIPNGIFKPFLDSNGED